MNKCFLVYYYLPKEDRNNSPSITGVSRSPSAFYYQFNPILQNEDSPPSHRHAEPLLRGDPSIHPIQHHDSYIALLGQKSANNIHSAWTFRRGTYAVTISQPAHSEMWTG